MLKTFYRSSKKEKQQINTRGLTLEWYVCGAYELTRISNAPSINTYVILSLPFIVWKREKLLRYLDEKFGAFDVSNEGHWVIHRHSTRPITWIKEQD